ncbi:MAG: Stage V sporulation protein E [Microgenomates group bacterium GW2011_GWC1_39_7b]|uniref:Probable peptidoglycan glycosyltransferase FtsW n=3 Tax=Candidatus Woeseibacteriota TaxID=1752722 RepID=A0A0G0LIN3_9BACT|nr:MAG: Stage V sporulation protein E [Candidatus Woesebacteria bacterium GW2011_GWB1_39_10]KKR26873.1 MAG: Stage V sporulation protein E [Microgenomates group bacterium GW2011_GWC1_39_7b]KKR74352.1 MAG: Stage V sporulation protein E [Candidatus Woesebacteria bacterium GW2011_GWA2_40_7]KKS90735.1 MAG: Stage V sporulation protein E [Candidatus Woesebacteria bacterium GW2011_GWA1_43_12]
MKKLVLSKQVKNIDKKLFWLILFFVALGLIFVADASAPQALNAYGDKFFLLRQQVVWAIVGIVTLFITINVHYSFWEKIATPFFFLSILFLLAVLLPHLSFAALGARRWISIGAFNFQPSEIIKLSLAIYLAKIAAKNKGAASYFIPLVLVTGLIMLQPDLGTTLVVAVIGLSQIFISGVNLLYFLGALITGALGTIGLILVSPYRRDRLLTFFETTSDPLGKGYHIRQILLALGSGGIFGVGLGASRQKYLFLPEASTDSIFAVIAEELGLIGSVAIISLYIYLFVKGVKIARSAPDKFSKVLAIGIVAWISGQAFLNIASMVSITPLTGIPLPFLSYGGTSLVMILSACGILLNISKYGSYENAMHSR